MNPTDLQSVWHPEDLAVGARLALHLLLAAAAALGVGGLAARLAQWRRGPGTGDPARWDPSIALLQLGCFLAGAAFAITTWVDEMSIGGFISGIPVLILATLMGRGLIEQVAYGTALILRGTLRVGTSVTIGEVSGLITGLTLTQTRLRGADGSTYWLSHRLMSGHAIRVGRIETVNTVTTVFASQTPTQARQLQTRAHFCPYRRAHTHVSLRRDPSRCEVSIHTWATDELAATQLRFEHWLQAPALDVPANRWHAPAGKQSLSK